MIQHRLLDRPKTTDHRETFSYLWHLTGHHDHAKKDYEGQALPVGNFSNRSIQTDGPLVVLGTNDDVHWHPILSIKEPGIYEIPIAVRSIKPIGTPDRETRVVVFINAA